MKIITRILLFSFAPLIAGCGNGIDSENYGKYSRAELRYYVYAPPMIPHKILNRKCLDCHKTGLIVEGFRAPATPHPELLICQQCHVRADENVAPFTQNNFAGLQEPPKLESIQPAAPPLIPHRVFMREKCLVCHGDATRKETTQTMHPERLNCAQCHVEQNLQIADWL
ncbi:MAG: hypothetical protein ACE5I1_04755 [bacterium]